MLPDTSKYKDAQVDYDIYLLKKKLCKRLSLYDIEISGDSIEVRFWIEPALYSPSQLYILKGTNSDWTVLHYILFERQINPGKDDLKTWDGVKNPRLDSIKMETLSPFKMTWESYISQLDIDSLWTLPSQSELEGSFGGLDGVSYSIELTDKNRYKLIHYSNPSSHVDKDINFRRFIDFQDKIIGPLSYNKMLAH